MRMGQGVRTGLGHGGISCVLQTQFSSFFLLFAVKVFEASFSSPERSSQRAVALPPASASASALASVLAKCQSFFVKVFM